MTPQDDTIRELEDLQAELFLACREPEPDASMLDAYRRTKAMLTRYRLPS